MTVEKRKPIKKGDKLTGLTEGEYRAHYDENILPEWCDEMGKYSEQVGEVICVSEDSILVAFSDETQPHPIAAWLYPIAAYL